MRIVKYLDRVGHLKAMAEKGPSPPSSPKLFRVVREEIPLSRRESEEDIARRLGKGASSSRSAAPVPKPRPRPKPESKVWSVLSFPQHSVAIEIASSLYNRDNADDTLAINVLYGSCTEIPNGFA